MRHGECKYGRRPDLGHHDAKATRQYPWRGRNCDFRPDGKEIHAEYRGVSRASQGLSEAADLQQIGKKRIEQHSDEQRNDHHSARYAKNGLVDFHDVRTWRSDSSAIRCRP